MQPYNFDTSYANPDEVIRALVRAITPRYNEHGANGSAPGRVRMPASNVPPETVERLRSVVQDWGREVTGAQQRLQEQIRAAASELSQIEELLIRRLESNGTDPRKEIEALRRENQALRDALAQRDARIQELVERISAQSGP